jgi:hypothetical protein
MWRKERDNKNGDDNNNNNTTYIPETMKLEEHAEHKENPWLPEGKVGTKSLHGKFPCNLDEGLIDKA